MAVVTWWEIEVARVATGSRMADEDPFGLDLPSEGLERLERLIGPILLPCSGCRLAIDIADRSPGDALECPGCGLAMGVPRPETWSPPRFADEADPDGLLGQVIDGIRFDRLLYRDEGVSVYRAWQLGYERPIAAKRLDASRLADPAALRRIRQEFWIGQQLVHPNLVRTLGLLAHGRSRILFMEYVDGVSVRQLLDRAEGLPVARTIRIARAVASALGYLHGRGLVHRDVKPANVLLDLTGGIRLADLELVERLGRADGALGTRRYMAPEAARGEPASARTDLYSLGATTYHMLAGAPPPGPDEPPPGPLERLRPDVPVRLSDLVGRLMARDPEKRPASAAEVERELGRDD